jgi:uncharacterized protein (TIGR03086 family)
LTRLSRFGPAADHFVRYDARLEITAAVRHSEVMDLDDLTQAQTAVTALLANLGPDAWRQPTPCDDWDVEAVARHLMVGERAFVVSLGGERYDLAALTAEVATVPLGDLPTAYGAGAAVLREALADADPAGAFPTGIGAMPATAIAELRTIEALTHGWDLARGSGAGLEVDDAVAERAIAHSLVLMERLPPERKVFGTPQPVPADAPAVDRLAALLGRTVSG